MFTLFKMESEVLKKQTAYSSWALFLWNKHSASKDCFTAVVKGPLAVCDANCCQSTSGKAAVASHVTVAQDCLANPGKLTGGGKMKVGGGQNGDGWSLG